MSAARTSQRRRAGVAAAAAVCLVASACMQQMAVQPNPRPLDASPVFVDRASARPPVPGTVPAARGEFGTRVEPELIVDEASDAFPLPVTAALLDRGQQRYEIYCAPCHGFTGNGDGMIVQRGFVEPPSFNTDRLRSVTVGHMYAVITYGYGAMATYASQVRPEDRWAIIAYIRTLQFSQHATIDDVPVIARPELEGGTK